MKRVSVALIGLVLAGAAVWGLVTAGPFIRWYVRARWYAVGAASREPAAEAAWRKAFGDHAEALAALQPREDNATAVRLTALGAAAGVNFSSPSGDSPESPSITSYIYAEGEKTGPVGPPPDAARAYLGSHSAGIDAVVELLVNADPPAWKAEEWLNASGFPSLAIKQLSVILTANALMLSSRSRHAAAERAFLAAWQLTSSLRDRPNVTTQFVAEGLADSEARVARRLTLDPASWRTRLVEHDYRASLIQAVVIHADHMLFRGTSQMQRASHADYLDRTRTFLLRLQSRSVTDAEAKSTLGLSPAPVYIYTSVGATVAAIQEPGLERAWLAANTVMLELELTAQTLQARQQKAQKGR